MAAFNNQRQRGTSPTEGSSDQSKIDEQPSKAGLQTTAQGQVTLSSHQTVASEKEDAAWRASVQYSELNQATTPAEATISNAVSLLEQIIGTLAVAAQLLTWLMDFSLHSSTRVSRTRWLYLAGPMEHRHGVGSEPRGCAWSLPQCPHRDRHYLSLQTLHGHTAL